MLRTDLKHDFVRSYAALLGEDTIDRPRLLALLATMTTEAGAVLAVRRHRASEPAHFALWLDLRYLGQYHEVSVEIPCRVGRNPATGTRSVARFTTATTGSTATRCATKARRCNW